MNIENNFQETITAPRILILKWKSMMVLKSSRKTNWSTLIMPGPWHCYARQRNIWTLNWKSVQKTEAEVWLDTTHILQLIK